MTLPRFRKESHFPLGERENGLLVRELLVDGGVRLQLLLAGILVLGVQVDLQGLSTVNGHAGALADNLGGADNVFEDGLMDSRQRARARSDRDALALEILVQDGTLSDENHVSLLELLLQLTDQAALNLGDASPASERHEDDNGVQARAHLDLLGGGDLDVAK